LRFIASRPTESIVSLQLIASSKELVLTIVTAQKS
jgi:hypothetical protein